MQVKPGTAWIAPGGRHMALKREGLRVTLEIHDDPAENSCRPAVDVLFRSVAEVYSNRALCLVLTGMGQDGADGMLALRDAGAETIAEDERSCVVFGMPREAIMLGAARHVVTLADMPARLAHCVQQRAHEPATPS